MVKSWTHEMNLKVNLKCFSGVVLANIAALLIQAIHPKPLNASLESLSSRVLHIDHCFYCFRNKIMLILSRRVSWGLCRIFNY